MLKYFKIYAPIILLLGASCGQGIYRKVDGDHENSLNLYSLEDFESLTKGGSGSKVYKIKINGKNLVWKKVQEGESTFEEEVNGIQNLSKNNLGPKLIHIDYKNSFYIYHFLDSQLITIEDRKSKALYKALSDVLKRVHSIPPGGLKKRLPYQIYNDNLERIYRKPNLSENTIKAVREISQIVDLSKENLIHDESVTHNDLIPYNTIYHDRKFKLIDPMMSIGNKYFDLATASLFWCFWPEAEQILYRSYFGRETTKIELAQMNNMKNIVRAVYFLRTILDISDDTHIEINDNIDMGWFEFLRANDVDNDVNRVKFVSILYRDIINNYKTTYQRNSKAKL